MTGGLLAVSYLRGLLVLITAGVMLVWVFWWMLRRSPDPKDMLARVAITAGIVAMGIFSINKLAGGGSPAGQIAGVLAGMIFGLFLAFIWVPKIADKVGEWFGNLYTGGSTPPDPEPFYSVARAKRKQGKFREAIYEIQRQLELFPDDLTGHGLLAEIQAVDLKDLSAAKVTVERFCQKPGRPPAHISYALNALADWHVKINLDPDSAREALERIRELLPETDQAMMAAQRLAHLATPEALAAAHEHKPIHLRAGATFVGLMEDSASLPVAGEGPEVTADKLVRQLEAHPLDCEAREKLAGLYAEHFGRLDLATEQLEQLVAAPHQPPKEVARWLNLLADFQVKHGAEYDTVRGTLQRIVDQFPGFAAENLAFQRIERLRLEFKGQNRGQVVKLGLYEKDLGLKRGRRAKD